MPVRLETAKRLIEGIFESYRHADDKDISITLPESVLKERTGKLYEAYVLAITVDQLCTKEGFHGSIRLVNGALNLRQSGGPIDYNYSHFKLCRDDVWLEVWTDIEFLTLSHSRRLTRPGASKYPERADCHELDILVVTATKDDGIRRYPKHSEVVIGVECKAVDDFKKLFARAVLGVRRELSYLKGATETPFEQWPLGTVPADPPSIVQVYSTDAKVEEYAKMGDVFGIQFMHLPIEGV